MVCGCGLSCSRYMCCFWNLIRFFLDIFCSCFFPFPIFIWVACHFSWPSPHCVVMSVHSFEGIKQCSWPDARFYRQRAQLPGPSLCSAYTALTMVFWCQRRPARLFLKVNIFFSVWAMIVIGCELASEVSRMRTEQASKPPKTPMANTENEIFTFRNTLNCLWQQKHHY